MLKKSSPCVFDSSTSSDKKKKKKCEDSSSSSSASGSPSCSSSATRATPSSLCACDCRGIDSSTPHSILFAAASAGDHAVKVWRAEIPPTLFVSSLSSFHQETQGEKKKTKAVQQRPGGREDDDQKVASGKKRMGGREPNDLPGVCTPQVLMTSVASVVAHRKEINDLQISPNDSVSDDSLTTRYRTASLGLRPA